MFKDMKTINNFIKIEKFNSFLVCVNNLKTVSKKEGRLNNPKKKEGRLYSRNVV